MLILVKRGLSRTEYAVNKKDGILPCVRDCVLGGLKVLRWVGAYFIGKWR
jgi:hypothetical protein